jgi:hypothetical protein
MVNEFNDLSSLAAEGKEWLEKKKEKEFKGAKYFWDQQKADRFANTDLEELLFDEYFLDGEDWMWTGVVDAVKDIWYQYQNNDVNLVLVLGGFGTGKTGGIDAILTWLAWFDFTCKYDPDSDIAAPQEYYGLRPDSTVAFIALSKTLTKSKQITFSAMQGLFNSQFNEDYFPVNPRVKSMVEIPNNHTVIFPNTATEAANAGYDVYYYVMDEVSFLKEVEDSTLAKGSKTTSYDQAEQAHRSAEGRRKSRFKDDGLGVLSSSANYDQDYLMRKIKDVYKAPEEHNNAVYKILLPWKTNPEKFEDNQGYFYFDTETYEIISDPEEIAAMERYYEEPEPDDLIFGSPEESENKQIIQQVRDDEFEFTEAEIQHAKSFLSCKEGV